MMSRLVLAAGFTLAAAVSAAPKRTPTPVPAAPKGPSLSAENRSQAQKVLAAAIGKRQASQWRAGTPRGGSPPGFQAHRCAVIYDEGVTGKERVANGPFRTKCSDWVSRASRGLAVKDGEQPCTPTQHGPGLVSCTSWVEQWDASRGRWAEVWRKSVP